MNFWHKMTWKTEGIRVIAPVKWRCLDGMVSVLWKAESQAGASGYYLADDPRIMIYFNDVSGRIRISNENGDFSGRQRPMARAIYIPAGVPMWTSSSAFHRFSHLNLHIHQDRLLRFLAPSIGSSAALAALKRPVELQLGIDAVETLAGLLAAEISSPSRHQLFAESLVGSIVTAMLELPAEPAKTVGGRLSKAQMTTLTEKLNGITDCRLTIAEMAETVGLSENWFATVFKQTTGKSPLQWQQANRIDRAKKLLLESDLPVAEIAVRLNFTDQAHLTNVFRKVTGATPATWRRMQQAD